MAENETTNFVFDASTLISYHEASAISLRTIGQNLGRIHVPVLVFDEVKRMSKTEAGKLKLILIEPSLPQLVEAAREAEGIQLSLNDMLCVIVARDNDWVCVTGDRRLRRECQAREVCVQWSLNPLGMLVRRKHLAARKAYAIAKRIVLPNPRIQDAILDDFKKKIGRRSLWHAELPEARSLGGL